MRVTDLIGACRQSVFEMQSARRFVVLLAIPTFLLSCSTSENRESFNSIDVDVPDSSVSLDESSLPELRGDLSVMSMSLAIATTGDDDYGNEPLGWSHQVLVVDGEDYHFLVSKKTRLGCKVNAGTTKYCNDGVRTFLNDPVRKYYDPCFFEITDVGSNNYAHYWLYAVSEADLAFLLKWRTSNGGAFGGGGWIWLDTTFRWIERNAPSEIREQHCNVPGDVVVTYREERLGSDGLGTNRIFNPKRPWDVGASRPPLIRPLRPEAPVIDPWEATGRQ